MTLPTQKQGGFIRFIALIVLLVIILTVMRADVRSFYHNLTNDPDKNTAEKATETLAYIWRTQVAEPAKIFWQKYIINLVTGKMFEGLKEKLQERGKDNIE